MFNRQKAAREKPFICKGVKAPIELQPFVPTQKLPTEAFPNCLPSRVPLSVYVPAQEAHGVHVKSAVYITCVEACRQPHWKHRAILGMVRDIPPQKKKKIHMSTVLVKTKLKRRQIIGSIAADTATPLLFQRAPRITHKESL